MEVMNGLLITIIGIVAYIALTFVAIALTSYRREDTPIWEVVVLSILTTPILAVIVEMLKPYRPEKKK